MHQFTLRLYYPADADLIAIRLKKGRGFTAEVRRCLGSYGKKGAEVPKFPVPEDIEKYVRAVDRPIIVNLNLYNYSSNFPYFTGFPACSLVK